jgi:hypothetical protein
MAAMMLWMGHARIMSGEIDLTAGALVFVLAHVVLVAAVLGLALFVPRVRRVLRDHRPDMGHVAGMLAGILVTSGSVHAIMHGMVL